MLEAFHNKQVGEFDKKISDQNQDFIKSTANVIDLTIKNFDKAPDMLKILENIKKYDSGIKTKNSEIINKNHQDRLESIKDNLQDFKTENTVALKECQECQNKTFNIENEINVKFTKDKGNIKEKIETELSLQKKIPI